MDPIRLTDKDALLVTDVQNDFLPGGSLAVPGGDEIIPVINRAIALFVRHKLPVYATRDWHPPGHCSFTAQGGIWPPHCVAYTPGAQFSPALELPADAIVVSKATTPGKDAYSSFEGTDLAQKLRTGGTKRLFVCGLATEYCVLNTVRDAIKQGLQVVLMQDAIKAIDLHPGDGQAAIDEMIALGARPLFIGHAGAASAG